MANRKRNGAMVTTVRARVPADIAAQVRADATKFERSESWVVRKILKHVYETPKVATRILEAA